MKPPRKPAEIPTNPFVHHAEIARLRREWDIYRYELAVYEERKKQQAARQHTIEVSLSEIEKQVGSSPLIDYLKEYFPAARPLMHYNDREREFFKKHKIESVIGAFAALGALLATKEHFSPESLTDGEGDAVRHCFWAAIMARVLGPEMAQTILDNHEAPAPNPMDLHNNSVGVRLGSDPAVTDLWGTCRKAAKDGRLQFRSSPGAQSTQSGPAGGVDNSRAGADGGGTGGAAGEARASAGRSAAETARPDARPGRDHDRDSPSPAKPEPGGPGNDGPKRPELA